MTLDEVAQLLHRISAYFPRWPLNVAAIPDWEEDLADIPLSDALEAWRRYRTEEGRDYPPTGAQLAALARALRPASELTEAEAEKRRNEYLRRAGYAVPDD